MSSEVCRRYLGGSKTAPRSTTRPLGRLGRAASLAVGEAQCRVTILEVLAASASIASAQWPCQELLAPSADGSPLSFQDVAC